MKQVRNIPFSGADLKTRTLYKKGVAAGGIDRLYFLRVRRIELLIVATNQVFKFKSTWNLKMLIPGGANWVVIDPREIEISDPSIRSHML